MKDLFKSIDCLRRSKQIQVGSTAEGTIVLGALKKKHLTCCQILRSKDSICSLPKSVSNIVKVLFKSIEHLRWIGKIYVSSKPEKSFVLGGLRKKYSTCCQILRS